jgi:hypothetical protein
MNYSLLKPIDVAKIKAVDFPEDKYFPIEYPKKQIVLHHTVSNPNSIQGDLDHWMTLDGRISTCMIIAGDGTPHQCFSSKYWGHHLGVKSTYLQTQGFTDWSTRNIELNKASIAIELDAWGGLILGDGTDKKFGTKVVTTIKGKYYAAYGNVITDEVEFIPEGFRGYYYYQKYSQAQIQTVGELLLLWNKKYGIPLDYNPAMFDISHDALAGNPGVWAHVSYRLPSDKQDIYPCKDLIEMLKTLKSLT